MQTRKPLLFLLCLVLVSQSCLTTTEPFVTYPAETPTAVRSTVVPRASVTPSPSAACAVIKADDALHLRKGAGVDSRVLAFMKSGEVVELISSTNAEWWLIKRGELVGYARSKYMEKREC